MQSFNHFATENSFSVWNSSIISSNHISKKAFFRFTVRFFVDKWLDSTVIVKQCVPNGEWVRERETVSFLNRQSTNNYRKARQCDPSIYTIVPVMQYCKLITLSQIKSNSQRFAFFFLLFVLFFLNSWNDLYNWLMSTVHSKPNVQFSYFFIRLNFSVGERKEMSIRITRIRFSCSVSQFTLRLYFMQGISITVITQ